MQLLDAHSTPLKSPYLINQQETLTLYSFDDNGNAVAATWQLLAQNGTSASMGGTLSTDILGYPYSAPGTGFSTTYNPPQPWLNATRLEAKIVATYGGASREFLIFSQS
jgi:hypothetical protein